MGKQFAMTTFSKYLTVYIIGIILIYLVWVFILWQPNPVYWEYEQRGAMVATDITFSFMLWSFYLIMEK